MSIRDLCQTYQSSTSKGDWNDWKKHLYQIATILEEENHSDSGNFRNVAYTLMMNDKPGYGSWLNKSIVKLINDSKARLDPLPDLLDYDEMSSKDLIDKYEFDDKNYSRQEILIELRRRYPSLIESDEMKSNLNLKDILKEYRGDFMTSVRDGYNRYDPDSTLNGFFPFWGCILLLLSFVFLLVAGIGLVGYLIGCRSPPDSLRQQLDPATFYA
ncbi:hypothetical protein I4U23_028891 [Adineta vaga]|nr:hypothetical protein I4U23_028891 [Adineta vaga]